MRFVFARGFAPVTPPGRKLLLLAGLLASLLADGAHDPALHDALRGLPRAPA